MCSGHLGCSAVPTRYSFHSEPVVPSRSRARVLCGAANRGMPLSIGRAAAKPFVVHVLAHRTLQFDADTNIRCRTACDARRAGNRVLRGCWIVAPPTSTDSPLCGLCWHTRHGRLQLNDGRLAGSLWTLGCPHIKIEHYMLCSDSHTNTICCVSPARVTGVRLRGKRGSSAPAAESPMLAFLLSTSGFARLRSMVPQARRGVMHPRPRFCK